MSDGQRRAHVTRYVTEAFTESFSQQFWKEQIVQSSAALCRFMQCFVLLGSCVYRFAELSSVVHCYKVLWKA